jgi:hypothetical protein
MAVNAVRNPQQEARLSGWNYDQEESLNWEGRLVRQGSYLILRVNTPVSTNRVISSELWDRTLHDSAKTPLRLVTIFWKYPQTCQGEYSGCWFTHIASAQKWVYYDTYVFTEKWPILCLHSDCVWEHEVGNIGGPWSHSIPTSSGCLPGYSQGSRRLHPHTIPQPEPRRRLVDIE